MEQESLKISEIKIPQQESGVTQHAQETRCDGVCLFSEAQNGVEKIPLSPTASNKVWQHAKDDRGSPMQEQVHLSVEEVSKPSSVVQIELQQFPKDDPPPKSKNEEEEVLDNVLATQPLNPGSNAQPQAGNEGKHLKSCPQRKKVIVGTIAAVFLGVVVVVAVISRTKNSLDPPFDDNHDNTTVSADASSGTKNFTYHTCTELDLCHKIEAIYTYDDKDLFQRGNNLIPKCCEMAYPSPGECTVCDARNITVIVCPKETVPKEGEGDQCHLNLKDTPPVNIVQPCHDQRVNMIKLD